MNNTIPDNWYENFFSCINCEMWEKAVTPDWTEKEVSLLTNTKNISKGHHILDNPCGTGRHAVSLAKKGFNVTEVDISEEFLKGLALKIKEDNLSIDATLGNILTLELTGTFDGAYCLGNSFGYFDYEGMKIFVQKVADCLKPGGRFVIKSGMVAETILPKIPPEKIYTIDNFTMQVNNQYFAADAYMVAA